MKRLKLWVLSLTTITFSQLLYSQTILSPPQPISLTGAETPAFGTEALHKVRFTVLADGTTDDVEVVGGFTTPFAKQFVSQSVSEWTFTPGTENGEPVDFYNQEFVIRAQLPEDFTISSNTEEKLKEATKLTEEGKFDRATRMLNRSISNNGLVTTFDYALTHEMLSSIYMAMDDPFRALETSKIATMSRTSSTGETEFILPPEVLETALRKRFLLAASVSQNSEALHAFETLNANFEIPADDPIIAQAEEIKVQIDSPDPLGMLAKITDKVWSYEPVRSVFTVTNVDGRLRKINVRCERKNLELDYEEGVDWTLPESFGKCILDFEGRNDTQFTVYEFSE